MVLLIFSLILLTVLIIVCIGQIRIKNKEVQRLFDKLKTLESEKEQKALELFSDFKTKEIELLKTQLSDSFYIQSLNSLEKWKEEHELKIRQDAINKSTSVIMGKVTEHLVPYFFDFPFNPKEVRFIGSPIDLIVFQNLESGEPVEIHFVEIKTGNSGLSTRQKSIKEAVDNKRVFWRKLTIEKGMAD